MPTNSTRPVKSSFGDAFCATLERREIVVLAGTLLAIFAASLLLAHHRPFWYDEIFTMLIAMQPNAHAFLRAMPADAQPPLLTLMVRGVVHLIGPTNIAGRLPSMTAFLVACVAVYLFLRRHCGIPIAFLGMALMASQAGWAYSYEARPYALLLAFTTLSLVCWQIATEQNTHRTPALIGMTFCIAGAMFSHQLGLVEVGFPILCGELWRLFRTRRLDWLGYAPFLIALPVLCITLPMVKNTRQALQPFLTVATPTYTFLSNLVRLAIDVRKSMSQVIGFSCLLLVIPLFFRLRKNFDTHAPRTSNLQGHEIAAAIGAALLIPVTLLVLLPTHSPYNCRYGIVTIAGLGMLGAFATKAWLPNRKDLLGLMLLLCGAGFLFQVRHNYAAVEPVVFPTLAGQDPQLPVVTTEAFNGFPLWWYATSSQRERFTLVYDPQALTGMEIFAAVERNNFPIHIQTYDEYLQTHKHFTSIVTRPSFLRRASQLGCHAVAMGEPKDRVFDITTNAKRNPSAAPETAP